MKDFFTGFKGTLTAAVIERLEKHRTGSTVEVRAVLDGMTRNAEKVKQTLNDKAVEVKAFALRIADDKRTQRTISRLSEGIDVAKDGLNGAASSVKSAIVEVRSPPANAPLVDTTEEHEKISTTIGKLEGRDKVGISAEVLGTAGGAAAGAAAAGTVASLAGASTILGSTTLGSALGGVFVATTPVGWLVGSAVVAGAVGYGIARIARSGARQDALRKEIVSRLKRRQQALEKDGGKPPSFEVLGRLVAHALASGSITEDQGLRLVGLVERGSLSVESAVQRLCALDQLSSADAAHNSRR
jgi:hypothetical protein